MKQLSKNVWVRRGFAFLLAFIMMLTMAPAAVFATDTGGGDSVTAGDGSGNAGDPSVIASESDAIQNNGEQPGEPDDTGDGQNDGEGVTDPPGQGPDFTSMLVAAMALGDVSTFDAGEPAGYITMSADANTLGFGLLYGPVKVPFYEGDSYWDVTKRFLGEGNYRGSSAISAIRLPDSSIEITSIDPLLLEDIEEWADMFWIDDYSLADIIAIGRSDRDYLTDKDYDVLDGYCSGWMYTVNNEFRDVVTNEFPVDGEVFRWQFSLVGWGADLGLDDMAGYTLYGAANRGALLTKVAEINSSADKAALLSNPAVQAAYNAAYTELANLTATQTLINTALTNLQTALDGGTPTKPESVIIASGNCGPDTDPSVVKWALYDDGTLVISGNGAIRDVDWQNELDVLWGQYSNRIESVIIEEGVTYIGDSAFDSDATTNEYTKLSNVTFPNSLLGMGDYAFSSCPSLEEVFFMGSTPPPGDLTDAFFDIPLRGTVYCPAGSKNLYQTKLYPTDLTFWTIIELAGTTEPDPELIAAKETKTAEINAVMDGLTEEDYTEESWEALETAIAAALDAVDAAATVSEVEAITAPDAESILVAKQAGPAVVASGDCGPDTDPEAIKWVLYDNGLLAIDGTGPMFDGMGTNTAKWKDYGSQIKEVVVSEGVATIGARAFYYTGNANLTSVSLPASLKTIGASAFVSCSGLKSITFAGSEPPALGSTNAFQTASGSGTIYCPASSVDVYAAWQTSVSAALFPLRNWTLVGVGGTEPDPELIVAKETKTAEINAVMDGLAEEDYTEESWSALQLLITNALAVVDAAATVAEVEAVILPDAESILVSKLSDFVIDGNGVLTLYRGPGGDIVIPEGVKKINGYVFSTNSSSGRYPKSAAPISSVVFPTTLEEIGGRAFLGNSVTDRNVLPAISTAGRTAEETAAGYVFPDGLKTIDVWAFSYSTLSGKIVIPVSVTSLCPSSIGAGAFQYSLIEEVFFEGTGAADEPWLGLADYQFTGCTELKKVSGERKLIAGGGPFRDCISLAEVYLPNFAGTIGTYFFTNCSSLESFEIPAGVTSIAGPSSATARSAPFDNTSIKELVVPATTTISAYAFNFSNLESIALLNKNITSISGSAFYKQSSHPGFYIYAYPGTATYNTLLNVGAGNNAWIPPFVRSLTRTVSFIAEGDNGEEIYSSESLFAAWDDVSKAGLSKDVKPSFETSALDALLAAHRDMYADFDTIYSANPAGNSYLNINANRNITRAFGVEGAWNFTYDGTNYGADESGSVAVDTDRVLVFRTGEPPVESVTLLGSISVTPDKAFDTLSCIKGTTIYAGNFANPGGTQAIDFMALTSAYDYYVNLGTDSLTFDLGVRTPEESDNLQLSYKIDGEPAQSGITADGSAFSGITVELGSDMTELEFTITTTEDASDISVYTINIIKGELEPLTTTSAAGGVIALEGRYAEGDKTKSTVLEVQYPLERFTYWGPYTSSFVSSIVAYVYNYKQETVTVAFTVAEGTDVNFVSTGTKTDGLHRINKLTTDPIMPGGRELTCFEVVYDLDGAAIAGGDLPSVPAVRVTPSSGTAKDYSITLQYRSPYEGVYTPDRLIDIHVGDPSQFGSGINQAHKVMSANGAWTHFVSLGGIGGYATYKFDDPIVNDPNSPYGIDFFITGNRGTGMEPGAVEVSRDGVNWYYLAGSAHYDLTTTMRNVELYPVPKSGVYRDALDLGYSRYPTNFEPIQFGYVDVAWCSDYGGDTIVGGGAVIGTPRNPYAHGSADGSNMDGGLAAALDVMDISWAVDSQGRPVYLPDISYIRVSTAIDSTDAGGLSTEVGTILRTDNYKKAEAVGLTETPGTLTVAGIDILAETPIETTEGGGTKTFYYELDVTSESLANVIVDARAASEGTDIFINSKRFSNAGIWTGLFADESSSGLYNAPGELMVRIIVHQGELHPLIYVVKVAGGDLEAAAANTELSSVLIYPGDMNLSMGKDGSYSATVPNVVEKISFAANALNAQATVELTAGDGLADPAWELIPRGENSESTYPLGVGENLFTLKVTAGNGTDSELYPVIVTREEEKIGLTVSFTLSGKVFPFKKAPETNADEAWVDAIVVEGVPEGSNVKYLTDMILQNLGYMLKITHGDSYIAGLSTPEDLYGGVYLGEFTTGPDSGWMYRYNGRVVNLGYAQQQVVDGSFIEWFYTDDYNLVEGTDWEDEEFVALNSAFNTLNALISSEEKLKRAAADYTEEGWQTYADALSGAKAINNDPESALEQVKGAAASLTEAIAGLDPIDPGTDPGDGVKLPTAEDVKAKLDLAAEAQLALLKNYSPVYPNFEWVMLGLARGGYLGSEASLIEDYLTNTSGAIAPLLDADGVLDRDKGTEHARLIVALTSLGIDASDFDGYDLTAAFASMQYLRYQGNNGPIWALIALDSGSYTVPQLPSGSSDTQTTREGLVADIVASQLSNGGWNSSRSSTTADPDMTGMALQALAPYYGKGDAAVDASVDAGIERLSLLQRADGGYVSNGDANSESCAQVIVALNALGIPLDDERFVKNSNTVWDAFLAFQNADGSFKHIASGTVDGMATEQGIYTLVSLYRSLTGAGTLYDMSDVALKAWPDSIKETGITKEELAAAARLAQYLMPSSYTAETWARVADALADAISVLTKQGGAAQEELDDAYNELANAIKALKPAEGAGPGPAVNKALLSSAITEAVKLKQADYTAASWASFSAALTIAMSVEAGANVKQSDVDSAKEALLSAMGRLEGTASGTPGPQQPANRSVLNTALAKANALTQSAYTAGSWAAFSAVRDIASAITADANASQTDIENAAYSLLTAMGGLVERASADSSYLPSTIPSTTTPRSSGGVTSSVNKTLLGEAIEQAAGLNQIDYTPESWLKLMNALETAQTVEGSGSASQTDINNARNALLSAVGALGTEGEDMSTIEGGQTPLSDSPVSSVPISEELSGTDTGGQGGMPAQMLIGIILLIVGAFLAGFFVNHIVRTVKKERKEAA